MGCTIFFCCCSLISICKHVLKFKFFGFFLSLTGDQQERKEMSFRHSVRANKKRGLVHPQLVHHQLPATNRQMALPILNPPQVCRKELLVDCPLGAIKNLGWKNSVRGFLFQQSLTARNF